MGTSIVNQQSKNPESPQAEKKSNGSFFSSQKNSKTSFFSPSILQTKLEIGSVGDVYEQEADRVADQVMRMPNETVQRKCNSCDDEKIQQKPLIQRKVNGNGNQTASSDITSGINATRGSGRSLDKSVSAEMGSKMGADFSGVKIHTDNRAIQLSQDLGAKAFTVGNDIYFNKGQYNPGSGEGKRLMAHELVHTVQQGDDTRMSRISRKPNNDEHEEKLRNVRYFNVMLGLSSPYLAILTICLKHMGWSINQAAIGAAIELSAGEFVGGGIGIERLLFFDPYNYKVKEDMIPYAKIGIQFGVEAGPSGSVIIGLQLGPIDDAGGKNDYDGKSYSASIQALATAGISVSDSLVKGKEGWIMFSVGAGGKLGFNLSVIYAKSGKEAVKEIEELFEKGNLFQSAHGKATGSVASKDLDNLSAITQSARNKKSPSKKEDKNKEIYYPEYGGIVMYKVKKGDTLSKIAIEFEVEGGWKEIYNLNKNEINKPKHLKEGQYIGIPTYSKSDELIIY